MSSFYASKFILIFITYIEVECNFLVLFTCTVEHEFVDESKSCKILFEGSFEFCAKVLIKLGPGRCFYVLWLFNSEASFGSLELLRKYKNCSKFMDIFELQRTP